MSEAKNSGALTLEDAIGMATPKAQPKPPADEVEEVEDLEDLEDEPELDLDDEENIDEDE